MTSFKSLPVKICAAALAATFGTAAGAADAQFVSKAAAGGMAEVEVGGIAQQKGSSPAVKDFAQKMVQDHTKANDELKQIASAKNMPLPAAPDASHKKASAMLQGKSGAGFDRAYKMQMVADHKATVALFRDEAQKGKDPELKAFAAKTLPDLQEHLKMAQALP